MISPLAHPTRLLISICSRPIHFYTTVSLISSFFSPSLPSFPFNLFTFHSLLSLPIVFSTSALHCLRCHWRCDTVHFSCLVRAFLLFSSWCHHLSASTLRRRTTSNLSSSAPPYPHPRSPSRFCLIHGYASSASLSVSLAVPPPLPQYLKLNGGKELTEFSPGTVLFFLLLSIKSFLLIPFLC